MSTTAKRRTLQKKDSIAQFAVDLSGDQLKELKAIFVELDKDKDGNLTGSELLEMFTELGVSAGANEISKLMRELDRDGDGRISFKEFIEGISWMKKSALFNKASQPSAAGPIAGSLARSPSVANFVKSLDSAKIQSIKELFDLADGDGDGIISKREFASLIKQLGLSVSGEQFELLFTTLDSSNDGKIEFGEFLSGMRWLEKGTNLSASVSSDAKGSAEPEDEALLALKELREQNKVLRGIIVESVAKALSTARVSLKNQDISTAKAVLEVVDIDFLLDVRDVTGAIVSEKDQALFTKMKNYIAENE